MDQNFRQSYFRFFYYIFLAQTINNQYKATYRASAALGDAVQPTRGSTKQILGKSMN